MTIASTSEVLTSEVLSRTECLNLLSSRSLGRVAVSRRALPAILPVAYSLLHDDVVFVSATGPDGLGELDGNVIAFEVDDITSLAGAGWSVTVVGVARLLDERDPDWCHVGDLVPGRGADAPAVELFRLSTNHMSGLIQRLRH
jgi:hypothetical protein